MAGGTSRRERKVVTVVFCDLVGFTTRAESMDPEDVEALLRPYHERVRTELERHGGTVEKFIGDAVMALFGAPTAHEDDPERAVRAALAIRDFAVEEGLELRVGITTGEALVRLDAQPAAGEGMASGDVVNTAARLQSAAPVNGIIVDEPTYRATRQAIDFRDADSVEAKGKSEPVPVREAVAAHSRLGVDVAHDPRSELVGRERELGVVRDAFERARHERTPQLLTLVGVPGIGKSRLVYELSRIVEADPELITWRQGRCLAYGDGITLWALAEIVKAQAGITEQDSPSDVAAKLNGATAEALPESDRAWVESHLLALAGLAEEAELGENRRNEAFAVWRRFIEGLAEQRPLVLVFEDLHWADESLLDFVDELVDWVTDVPLLVVATARPELLERRPAWGGGKLNATTLALSPLTDEQTAQLLGGVLGSPLLAVESQSTLLERAGGNPLYAEQFAELYRERGSADELPLPETLQGIIAARLDGLGADEKSLVLDAAVVGKVFWTGSLGRTEDEAIATLHQLERKGFVQRQRRSSVEGESELAFAHALVRDVAYGQIPRAERAAKHRRVAEWIESLGRLEDHAEMRAYHWSAALDLLRASGAEDPDVVDGARLSLRDAADRAFGLNAFTTAASQYDQALALWPDDPPGRAQLLFRRGRALYVAATDYRAEEVLEAARAALLEVGELESAAEAQSLLAHTLWVEGRRDAAYEQLAAAQELVATRPASIAKARVLATSARFQMLAGDREAAIRLAREALALAEELDLNELQAHALATIGSATPVGQGSSGRDELEQALEIALAARSPIASSIMNNLAVHLWLSGELARADDLYREAEGVAAQFGEGTGVRWSRGNQLQAAFTLGRWDEAEEAATRFIRECESSPHYLESAAREVRAMVRLGRGDVEGALADFDRALDLARVARDPQSIVPSLLDYARACAMLGRTEQARGLAEEALTHVAEAPSMAGILGNVLGARAHELGVADRARDLMPEPTGPFQYAAIANLDRDYARAAEIYDGMGAVRFAASARVASAEQLLAAGRRAEAEAELEKALAFYRSVGATFLIREAEGLLAASAQSESA